jgi:hypothetical protein
MFPPPIEPAENGRRASRRHSLLWDMLNPNRMRDATAQERIDALRRVREQRGSNSTEELEARRRRRLTARLHGFSIRTTVRGRGAPASESGAAGPSTAATTTVVPEEQALDPQTTPDPQTTLDPQTTPLPPSPPPPPSGQTSSQAQTNDSTARIS